MRITELLVEGINNLRTNNDHLTRERDEARAAKTKWPVLGQEAIVGRDGLGRVTEIGPADRCGSDQPEWIGVTPYAGRTWQMNFAPHNVRLVKIKEEAKP